MMERQCWLVGKKNPPLPHYWTALAEQKLKLTETECHVIAHGDDRGKINTILSLN